MSVVEQAVEGAVLPPLKWAGGKRWQVPHLVGYWARHRHERMVEPFCGGLAVTLGLMPARALLNDINPHLVNYASLGFTLRFLNAPRRVSCTGDRSPAREVLAIRNLKD